MPEVWFDPDPDTPGWRKFRGCVLFCAVAAFAAFAVVYGVFLILALAG